MATPTQIAEVDFNKIRDNIKTFLKSQSEFSDFDFDGAGVSVLIDILAYSSHYLGILANMSFSEMFLNTAQLRSSVVAHAEKLGYVPRQKQAAKATLTISVTPQGSPASIVMPAETTFSSTYGGTSYTFVTPTDYQLLPAGGGVYQATVDVVQGIYRTVKYTYDSVLPTRLIIPTADVDTDYITVTVKANPQDPMALAVAYTRATDATALDGTSQVFFVRETTDGEVEILFGDGVLGTAVADGSEVTIKYLETAGSVANGVKTFQLTAGFGGYPASSFTIVPDSTGAVGGSDNETIESIRSLAPKVYQAQGRCVTVDDYKAKLLDQFGWIESINVWGGEDNVPSVFGKVFISIKPNYGTTTTPVVKQEIRNFLDQYRIVGIVPEIVDPDYIYTDLDVVFNYNREATTYTQVELEQIVRNAIEQFFINNITSNFDATLNYSQLATAIDSADPAVVSNTTKLTLSKTIVPNTTDFFTYQLEFANELIPGSVVSDKWTSPSGMEYYFADDREGNLNLYQDGVMMQSEMNKHTVDYTNGTIILTAWRPDAAPATTITLRGTPATTDIATVRNMLILLGNINITSAFLR